MSKYIKVTTACASASPIQEQFDQLTAERDQFRDTVTDQVKAIQKLTAERDALRAELSGVMRERRDALQRAWNAEEDLERLRAELEATEASHQDEEAAHAETRSQRDLARAQLANTRTENLAAKQVIVDAFAVEQLRELREAAADVCGHVLTSHECSHGEVIDRLAAVLEKVQP